ncbi:hypothetical protein DERP_009148 [Dermatophagoides pteronyssinus]|uniref:Uncharacterized protein n=1 Tax=Dermatophagoides pteronyssinus TaxID=6956 RepID=A0ABQ8JQP0_DERPT|nr:hypothetical protein DERP_009148 [Dermatophagoides pteronyssinus]
MICNNNIVKIKKVAIYDSCLIMVSVFVYEYDDPINIVVMLSGGNFYHVIDLGCNQHPYYRSQLAP